MNVAAELGAAEVKDLEGNPVRLGTLWSDKPAVVVWVRHFG